MLRLSCRSIKLLASVGDQRKLSSAYIMKPTSLLGFSFVLLFGGVQCNGILDDSPGAAARTASCDGGNLRGRKNQAKRSAGLEPRAYRASIKAVKGHRPYMVRCGHRPLTRSSVFLFFAFFNSSRSLRFAHSLRFSVKQEDEFFVSNGSHFCGVFDGHGGSKVSTYLRENLYKKVSNLALVFLFVGADDGIRALGWLTLNILLLPNLQFEALTSSVAKENGDDPANPRKETVVEALRKAISEADAYVQRMVRWSFQGSTAVVCCIHNDKATGESTIIAANVGDSRAVLSRGQKAVNLVSRARPVSRVNLYNIILFLYRLAHPSSKQNKRKTTDHKPNDKREKARVKKLGGKVSWFGFRDKNGRPIPGSGVYRINGNLAVARAIGDRSETPFVTSESEIMEFKSDLEKDDFIILASDGIWDVMTSQEAVTYVHNMMKGGVGALPRGAVTLRRGKGFPSRTADFKLTDWSMTHSDDR